MTNSAITISNQSWLARHRRRIAEVGIGHAIYATFNFICDHIIYVYVIYRFGLLVGGVLMTTFPLVQCAATLLIYDRMGRDWVGAGSLAHLSELPEPNCWQRIIRRAMRHGNTPIFLALCFFQDPFITTAYFRRGRFGGLLARDWHIFFASVFVSNLYWTLRSGAIAAVLFSLWQFLTSV